MTDPEAVARSLSEAQRRAIIGSPRVDRINRYTPLRTAAVLERLGITEGDTGLYYSPLGLAVRAILETPNDQ